MEFKSQIGTVSEKVPLVYWLLAYFSVVSPKSTEISLRLTSTLYLVSPLTVLTTKPKTKNDNFYRDVFLGKEFVSDNTEELAEAND